MDNQKLFEAAKEAIDELYSDRSVSQAKAIENLEELEVFIQSLKDTLNPRNKMIRTCRVCGCTDYDCSQCVEKTGQPCYWVEEDLCSVCVKTIKAISCKQPWANMISYKFKLIETRTWKTEYRGDLLIVSSLKPDKQMIENLRDSFDGIQGVAEFYEQNILQGPYGMAICVAELYDIKLMTRGADEANVCCFIYDGAYSWFLRNIRPVVPFPVKGQLRLFDVPESLIKYKEAL
jgi:hypothetical protein